MDKTHEHRKVKKFHLPAKDHEYFTSNLAAMLQAGVGVGETLESLQASSNSKPFKAAMQQMQDDINEGMPLWKAFERSGIVSSQTLALVRLGEESGNLSQNLSVAAKQEEKQRIFKSKVRSALLYPGFVLSLTVTVGVGVAWFLLPKLSDTFTNLHVKLPTISKVFIALGVFLRENGFWAVPTLLIGLIVILYVVFAAPKTKRLGNWILFHIPGVSKLLYEVEIARFGYLLGTLLEAGLPVTKAFDLLEKSTTAHRYQHLYRYLNQSFENGYDFQRSLSKYPHAHTLLPASVQQILMTGEQSGTLPETLKHIGETYEEKADISTKNLEVVLEPILLVFVWLGVLGVAVAVILPVYQLVGGLGNQ